MSHAHARFDCERGERARAASALDIFMGHVPNTNYQLYLKECFRLDNPNIRESCRLSAPCEAVGAENRIDAGLRSGQFSSVAQQNPYLLQARRKELRSKNVHWIASAKAPFAAKVRIRVRAVDSRSSPTRSRSKNPSNSPLLIQTFGGATGAHGATWRRSSVTKAGRCR
ncbi:hypothetical protein EVAR_65125_1 [Eumeta japonica]|uniref:Uncharacterized protein n=1 Tax=Eumeta variegata TaxID=151549 RepID=A0A4C1Z987_EUMVA|nr:hypothetical protein EVAR_65125_1 [Eumeta japonica]